MRALVELSHLPEIVALQSAPGEFPSFDIGATNVEADYIPVIVKTINQTRATGIFHPAQWKNFAEQLAGPGNPPDPNIELIYQDLLVCAAHCSLNQDILITFSPNLLRNRDRGFIRDANPRTPTEAARIAGLFLRSRGNYTYAAYRSGRATFDRGLFYWILMRHRLPAMWRYFEACVLAEKVCQDDIVHLSQSILTRCERAIQARDEVGEQFYIPQGNNARDAIMYHFDYLTLLLAGALDAQARVAHRIYKITRPRENDASFRRHAFLKVLEQPASSLFSLVSDSYNRDVMSLIYLPRHTIHGAALHPLAYQNGVEPEVSFVSVPQEHSESIWQMTERCGSAAKWGLTCIAQQVLMEPYTYATTLVDEGLKLINKIASTTDVFRLFPQNYPVPEIRDRPPEDNVFSERIRERLAVLG